MSYRTLLIGGKQDVLQQKTYVDVLLCLGSRYRDGLWEQLKNLADFSRTVCSDGDCENSRPALTLLDLDSCGGCEMLVTYSTCFAANRSFQTGATCPILQVCHQRAFRKADHRGDWGPLDSEELIRDGDGTRSWR